jgi:hypothetical protein
MIKRSYKKIIQIKKKKKYEKIIEELIKIGRNLTNNVTTEKTENY